MDFSFSEEQDAIRALAAEILGAEMTQERLRAAERETDWTDAKLWQQLAEANLLGVAIPEAHGGMGMGFLELCVLLEQVGRAVAPGPWLPTLVHGALTLAEFGTPAQQAAWLPRVAAGTARLAAALQDAGSAEGAPPGTRARAEGAGFVLDGAKRCVPGAGSADLLLVPASEETPGASGVGIYLVDPKAAGISLEARVTSAGEPLFEVTLSGVRVAADARLGGEAADGAAMLRWLAPRAQTALAALQAGVSERALRITADYVKERVQFGVPIGSFQAVQHREADGFIDLEAMRWTLWQAAWRLASGLPAEREAAVATFWASEGGSRIANASLHLHGGLGSDVDYPIHRHFLWSKALELAGGGASATLAALGRDLVRTGPGELR
jgi:alkylation response protein AidB-like acyl-CoA dehydrogenase